MKFKNKIRIRLMAFLSYLFQNIIVLIITKNIAISHKVPYVRPYDVNRNLLNILKKDG